EPFFDYNGLCYDMFQNNIVIYELNITGNELDVTFSNTTITPMVALLKGDVTTDSLYIVECSSGLNHTYYNINAGETVWVVISGSSPSDNGSFDVSFQNNFACNDCVQEDILVASPSPYYGGYKPGETVNFCYSISNYQDESTSWFHGIAPLFGNGWNTATLVQTFIPPECQSTPTGGLWGWYNSVTGTGTGLTAGPGFFFDADIDGDPGNNFGDNCVDAAANWTFCWSIQARLDTLSGRDLSVEVENYSDGETGSWTDAVCASDANYLINAYMQSPDFLHDTAIVDVLCNGESTGSISLSNFEFGTTAYSFQWSNGATNANITGLAVNTYAVTITDYLSFTTTESYTVTEPSAITATTSTTNSNCSSADGSASATGSGGTGSFSYLWSTSETANTITGLVTGTYTVTATDGNACTAITTSVVSDIGAGIVSVTETDASCNGACDGFVTTTITGGTLPYNYLWSDGQTTDNATGLCAGAYSATITDGIGCVIIQSGTISEPSAITVTSAVTLNESCTIADDGIVNTTVTGGAGAGTYTYIWNTGATTDGLSGLSGGVYTVTVNAGACQQIAAETVTITPDITITSVVQGQSAVFPDGYVNTTVTGGSGAGTYTYIWTTGQIIDDISGLAAGTYCVTVNSGICQQVTCGVVTVAPGISVTTSVIQNESCVGSSDGVISATASGGGGGPYTYFWNTGAVTNSISGLTTGIYIVTVDPGAGQAVSSQSITVSSNLSLSTSVTSNYNGAEISCNGNSDGTASVSVVGGASPYSYLWSNGSFAFTASGLSAGNHNVTVTDGNLCQGSASVLLTEPNILLANPLIDNDETCSGDCDGQATAFPGGGTGGYSYSWLSGGTSPTTSGLCPGSEDITVIDANGCSIVETISITSGAIVTAVINPVPSQCLGNNFNFDGSGSSTSTANTLSFNWDFGDANTATGFGPSNTYSSAGTFSVVLTVTDIGCTDITSSVLEVYSNPVLSGGLMIEPMCSGNSDGAINVTVTSGTTGYNYNWSNGSPSPNIGLLSAGFYSLTVTDANNCITQGNFNLGEPSALSITQTCNPTSGVGASDGGSTVAGSGGSGFYT
ncbi:MAG: hypothetical protein JKY53_00505, partial [Flavobacteriales bacterium]|nr:hypothetical protein [Flavobacteriales bacterium]